MKLRRFMSVSLLSFLYRPAWTTGVRRDTGRAAASGTLHPCWPSAHWDKYPCAYNLRTISLWKRNMDADFWLERWNEGRTHFHQDRVTPLLQKLWPTLALPAGSRVLVPLCGKSLDMVWLAEQDMRVLGVELSPLAVEQFFSENKLQPAV